MTLPAFAAERGRLKETWIDSWYAAPVPTAVDRYLRSKPAARRCYCRSMGQTDGQTGDARPLHRPCTA